jgi:hypothetical protein
VIGTFPFEGGRIICKWRRFEIAIFKLLKDDFKLTLSLFVREVRKEGNVE